MSPKLNAVIVPGDVRRCDHSRLEPGLSEVVLLQRAQPAMTGLIDGSLSTLAPIFAVVLAASTRTLTKHDHPLLQIEPTERKSRWRGQA